ncbi:TnsA endonuclease N-terminal domain-containing protein [Pseudomonas rossensis]|uniref:TnsA endonuclease N-terminal domain-containing protein n=1 Tax=Pseudomonas rossensis TaxID=2305471 RepID=UPI003260D504
MRGRSFKTQSDIDRHIEKGFGQGSQELYVPWLRVQDVPSHGRSRKVQGAKVDRIHHLLSDLEYWYLLIAEFSPEVLDIREQYPLLPVSTVQSIAHALNIRYPVYLGTKVPYVMTTDFLLTILEPDGSTRLAARTLKYTESLKSGKGLERTLEKFEIERAYWSGRGVDWNIVTEKDLPTTLIQNLDWLRKAATLQRHLQQRPLTESFLEELARVREYQWPIDRVLRQIAGALFIPYTDAKAMFMHLVWHKHIVLDLTAERFSMKSTLPAIKVVWPSKNHDHELKVG